MSIQALDQMLCEIFAIKHKSVLTFSALRLVEGTVCSIYETCVNLFAVVSILEAIEK